jgi:ABC-type sugar transport system substrate-binding protein
MAADKAKARTEKETNAFFNRLLLAVPVFLIVLVMAAVYYLETSANSAPKENASISVVLYGGPDRWHSLEQGIVQACDELGIERPTPLYSLKEGVDEQERLITRELNAGSKGILTAVSDSGAMGAFLREANKSTPVVTVESGVEGMAAVSADNRAMGAAIAEAVKASPEASSVLIVNNAAKDSVAQRFAGFLEACGCPADASAEDVSAALGKKAVLLDFDEKTFASSISRAAHASGVDAIVALDTETMESVIDLLPPDARIFGAGVGTKALYALDEGVTEALCHQDEFSIGYIGLMDLAARLGYKTPAFPRVVPFRMVSRAEMHAPETERLLFPMY